MPHPVTLKRQKKRKELIKILGGKCAHCGSIKNLEFDHLDPSAKEFRVSEMLDWGDAKLLAEVNKCQLLCKKCHHKKTLEKWEYGSEAPHGGMWRWRKYKCRCPLCLNAKDRYNDYRRSLYRMKTTIASELVSLLSLLPPKEG